MPNVCHFIPLCNTFWSFTTHGPSRLHAYALFKGREGGTPYEQQAGFGSYIAEKSGDMRTAVLPRSIRSARIDRRTQCDGGEEPLCMDGSCSATTFLASTTTF